MKVRIKSVPKFAQGGNLPSPEKSREILKDGTIRGKKISEKQRRLFGYLASKAKNGSTMQPTTQEGLTVEDGKYKTLSPDSIELTGEKHSNGGQDISYGGRTVEAEKGEVVQQDPQTGNITVMGQMQVPGTNKSFKQVAKDLNEKEQKAREFEQNGTDLVLDKDPNDKWEGLAFNAGQVMMEGGHQKVEQIQQNKDTLAETQQALLDIASENNLDPNDLSRGKITTDNTSPEKAPNGTTIENIKNQAVQAANQAGIDPNIFLNLIQAESDFNPKSTGESRFGTARGLVQLMPDEAKKYGITNEQLSSSNPEDIAKVLQAGANQLANLTKQYNGDYKLALAAYNGGQGAIDLAKEALGKDTITGDEWLAYMQRRREEQPSDKKSAWQNETFNYVNKITGGTPEELQNFNRNYYQQPEVPVDYTPVPENVEVPQLQQPTQPVTTQQQTPTPTPTYTPATFTNTLQKQRNIPSNAGILNPLQILPEMIGLRNNAQQPVFQQDYQPELFEPYRVSFQDRVNENNRQLNALKQSPYFANNPQALSVLAGQTYNANNQVIADEFRTNQSIANDVTNKNVSLLNEAQATNLKLQDQAFVRQTQANANTRSVNHLLMNSLIDKVIKNQLENRRLKALEPLTTYRYDAQGNLVNMSGLTPAEEINWSGIPPTSTKEIVKTSYDGNNRVKSKTVTKIPKK